MVSTVVILHCFRQVHFDYLVEDPLEKKQDDEKGNTKITLMLN